MNGYPMNSIETGVETMANCDSFEGLRICLSNKLGLGIRFTSLI